MRGHFQNQMIRRNKTERRGSELLSEKLSFNAWVLEMWSRNLTRQFLFFQFLYVSNTASRETQRHELSREI